jgi:hypothetical protein
MAFNVAPSTPLNFVSPGVYVIAKNVTDLAKRAAHPTNLVTQGYDLKRVDTHSLRALSAMALKLQGVDDTTIMKSAVGPASLSSHISTPKSAPSTSVW